MLAIPAAAQEPGGEGADGWEESVDGIAMQEAIRAIEKDGLRWCAMPFLNYSQQLGFSGKVAGTLFDFGHGSFPSYDQMIYGEMGYSSQKAGTFRVYFDSKKLIEGFKVDFDIAYQPDALYDFYGYNGYESFYDYYYIRPFYNENFYLHENPQYIGSAFYKMKRNMFRLAADIRGPLSDSIPLFWHAGLGLHHYAVGHVDVAHYNRGKAPLDQLEDTLSLYDLYNEWGLISPAEANGGWNPYLHAGVSIDSRDRDINPQHGYYGDLFLTGTLDANAPKEFSNLKINFNWKHHVCLWEDVVTLAYLVGGQLTLVGGTPFYQNGTINQMLSQRDMFDGTGGANMPRGMLRNRVLGKGYNYASVELRANVFQFKVGTEQVVVSLNPFVDEIMLLQPYDLQGLDYAPATQQYFSHSTSVYMPHISAGLGAKATVNNSFVASCDWALPLKEQDNEHLMNLYFSLGYLF